MDAEVCWYKKMTKFGIRKKNLRRGKVEKSSTFLFQKKLNLRYYLPRLTLGTMDTHVGRSIIIASEMSLDKTH